MILLKDTEHNKIGFIKDQDTSKTLSVVRKIIEEEHELNFNFTLFGAELTVLQEDKYKLSQCLVETEEKGFQHQLVVVKKIEKIEVRKNMYANESPGNEVVTIEDYDGESTLPKVHKPSSKVAKISPRVAKLKLYSAEKIQNAEKFLEKERMEHYNKLCDQIMLDPKYDSWGFQALEGLIDVAWTKKKTELLILLVKSRDMIDPSSSTKSMKENEVAIMKNFDKVREAQFKLDQGYETFCEGIVKKGESHRHRLEQIFGDLFSSLKKAQASLIKSLEGTNVTVNKETETQPHSFISGEELQKAYENLNSDDVISEVLSLEDEFEDLTS